MSVLNDEFDYIIVGGGSAGAVLANRLSADPAVSVCLIEAGEEAKSPVIKVPLGLMLLAKSARYNWLLKSSPQAALNHRIINVPRGKVLGGSSSINGMVYIRGHRADYDEWANAGCEGWDYDSVLPYFKKSEANSNASLAEDFHGRDGELAVSDLSDPNEIDNDFVEAANQLQIPTCADFNVSEPEGVGVYQVTQKNGRRHSTASAFLDGVRHRSNLTVATSTEVSHLLLENKQVTGVVLKPNAYGVDTVRARVETVLAAGAIGSPDILLRSGIGSADALTDSDITLTHPLKGVGKNLHDHVDVMVLCTTQSITSYGFSLRALPRLAMDVGRWVFNKRGMFSSNMVEAGGFVRSSPDQDRPDIQFHIIPGRKSHRGRLIEYGHGISLHACVLNPLSRGRVTRSTKEGPPSIDLGLLNDDRDLDRLLKGMQTARQILNQPPFEKHTVNELLPGKHVNDEAELKNYIRQHARTVYHPVGTCAMGIGTEAVVDSRLRVHGLAGVRIADASIMPSIVRGNTNAPTIMIAEKAADMIIEDRITVRE